MLLLDKGDPLNRNIAPSKSTVATKKSSRKTPKDNFVFGRKFNLKSKVSLKALAVVLVFGIGASIYIGQSFAATGGQIVGISKKCLDNKGGKTTSNNPVQLSSCSTGSSQQWIWTGNKTIRTQSKCLDVKSSAVSAGSLIVINSCNGGASQNWALQANGTIVNSNSTLCLTDRKAVTSNGNPIELAVCNGSASQIWNITKAVVSLPQTKPASHAALPSGVRNTPKPTVTIESSGAPEMTAWLQNVIKPLLEQWYPVLGDYYAYPEYTPINTIVLKADMTYNGIAGTSGSTVMFSPDFFRTRQADAPGAFMHEVTHVLQGNPTPNVRNAPGWMTEGMADYTREHIYNDRAPRDTFTYETYQDGYSPAANLLFYAQAHSTTANLIHAMNVATYSGMYSDALFAQKSGQTIAQQWTNMTGQVITNSGHITNGISGKCMDLPYFSTTNGTRIKIQNCNSYEAENWNFSAVKPSSTVGVIKGAIGNKCLDAANNGTAAGTPVVYYDCNFGDAQKWIQQADGSLLEVYAKKCLQPVRQSNDEGTMLELGVCDGSAAQRWTLPVISTPKV